MIVRHSRVCRPPEPPPVTRAPPPDDGHIKSEINYLFIALIIIRTTGRSEQAHTHTHTPKQTAHT